LPVVYPFPFRRFNYAGGSVFRPVVTVRVHGPLRSLRLRMLVDSGADCSLINPRHAKTLGLRLEKTRGGRVVSHPLAVSRSEILLEVRHVSGWLSPIRIPVEIPPEPMGLPFAVLGREGFFEAFDVAFLLGPAPGRGMFCLSSAPGPRSCRAIWGRDPRARKRGRIAA